MNILLHRPQTCGDALPTVQQEALKIHRTFRWIMISGITLSLGLGFVYLILLNSLATKGFALESLKLERSNIQKELEQWDIAVAIPSSLYALKSSEQVQEMETIEKRDFVFVREGKVAMGNEQRTTSN